MSDGTARRGAVSFPLSDNEDLTFPGGNLREALWSREKFSCPPLIQEIRASALGFKLAANYGRLFTNDSVEQESNRKIICLII